MREEIRLSTVALAGTELLREGSFGSLGYLSDKRAQKLVFIETEDMANKITQDDTVSCAIVGSALADRMPPAIGVLVSSNPSATFFEVHNKLAAESHFYGDPFKSLIDPTANIHKSASIAENSVRIGRHCRIEANAVVGEGSVLEEAVSIGPGSVIGCGSRVCLRKDRIAHELTSTGGVLLRVHSEIRANCCVSRAVLGGDTILGEYTMLDNLVSVGESAKVGRRCLLAANCAIGSHTHVGDDVWIGPSAVLMENITVGHKAFVTIGSVVVGDVAEGQKVTGNFAVDHQKFVDFIKRIR